MARMMVRLDDVDKTRLSELAANRGESEATFAARALRRALIAAEIADYRHNPDAETIEWMNAATAESEHLFIAGAELDTDNGAV